MYLFIYLFIYLLLFECLRPTLQDIFPYIITM